MAIKHLANISLEGNEIQNVKLHPLGTAPTGAEGQVFYNTATDKLMVHNGTAWYSVNGDVESIGVNSNSTNAISVGGTEAVPALEILTAAITNGGTALATGDQIYDFVTDAIGDIPAGANTTYTISVEAGAANTSVIRLTAGGSGSGTDDVTISGGDNISVTESGETITVQLTDDVQVAGDLIVDGDLTVSGTTTTVNTETINLADNIITLNSNEAGTPSENGGIEVERGTSTNTVLRFNETTDRWEFTNDGSTYHNIPVATEFNTVIGTDTDIDNDGAEVVETISLTDGVVTGHTKRTLTLANLGYTGATDANNFVHPTHAGDDISIDTTLLSGATIISDLDLNVTTDLLGHVTDANATIATRELTPADIGAQASGTYNTIIGTDTDINTSGIIVIDQLNMTDGVVQSHSTRNLPSSSTTAKGVVELATNAETSTGTDATRAVTPAGLASVLGDVLGSGNHKSFLIGDATQTAITVTHTMSTKNIMVQVTEESTGETVFTEVSRPTDSTVIVTFATAPTTNQYRVHLIKTEY